MRKNLQIAIDGPVGAGKSTVASNLAKKLKLWRVDTGAMYRLAAYLVIKKRINPEDEEGVFEELRQSNFKILPGRGKEKGRVLLEGQEVAGKIRSEVVGKVVARVARLPKVREFLVERQQKLVRGKDVVVEGRDIGTRVLPKASVKIFLTGSFKERVKRKHREVKKRDGLLDFVKLSLEIKRRDERDRKRKVDPLKKAEDAIEMDTTKLNINEVVEKIIKIVEEKTGRRREEKKIGVNNGKN